MSNTSVRIDPPGGEWKRYAVTHTLTGTGVAFVRIDLVVAYAVDEVFDFTVRIGAPQLEKADFVSSVVLPPPTEVDAPPETGDEGDAGLEWALPPLEADWMPPETAPECPPPPPGAGDVFAASTRARDAFALGGSLDGGVLSYALRAALARDGGDVGGGANLLMLAPGPTYINCYRVTNDNGVLSAAKRETGTTPVNSVRPGGAIAPGQFTTVAAAYDTTSAATAWDGAAAVVDDAPGVALASLTVNRLNHGIDFDGANIIARFLRIWDGVRLTDKQVQAASGKKN